MRRRPENSPWDFRWWPDALGIAVLVLVALPFLLAAWLWVGDLIGGNPSGSARVD